MNDNCLHCNKYIECGKCDHCGKYSSDLLDEISWIYIIAIVMWLFFMYLTGIYITDYIGFLILMIAPIFYVIQIYMLDICSSESESDLFKFDILALGIIIINIMLSKEKSEYNRFFTKIVVYGILLLIISSLDFWTSKRGLIISRHIRTIFRTAATVIFGYMFYMFYIITTKDFPLLKNPIC